MKISLSFEKLSNKNKETMKDLMKKLFGKKVYSFGYTDSMFDDILQMKYKSFYPIFTYEMIKINDEPCGILGFNNTFLFTEDIWIGWFRISDEFKDINPNEKALMLLERRIKKKYPEVNHVRGYYSKTGNKFEINMLKKLDYIEGTKMFSNFGENDIIILSKCLKGKYKEWKGKPVW